MAARAGLGLRSCATVLAAALLLNGCASMGAGTETASNEPLSPAEQRLHDQAKDYNRTIAEGVGLGLLAGCGAGAAIGRGRWESILIGCLGGAALGAAGGTYYAEVKKKYATEEARLDKMIADVDAENRDAEAKLAVAQTVARDDTAKINQVKAQLAAKQIDRRQAERQLASVDRNRKDLEQTLIGMKKRRDEFQQAANDARKDGGGRNVGELNREIAQLETNIAAYQQTVDALTSHRTSVVG